MAKKAKTTPTTARVREAIEVLLAANGTAQLVVTRHGAEVPLVVLKALADVDWACRALVAAETAWPTTE